MCRLLRRTLQAGLVLTLVAASSPARAEDRPARIDMFSGVTWQGQSGSTYLGGTYAFGKSLHQAGPRVRAKGAYGLYRYRGEYVVEVPDFKVTVETDFLGQYGYLEGMAGWQFQRGPAVIKLFGGIVDQEHLIQPNDARNPVQGHKLGPAAAVELWWTLSPTAWAQLDLFGTTSFGVYSVRGRVGRRLRPRIAVGLEAGAVGNDANDTVEAGAFLRLWLRNTEITLSGGATGAYLLDGTVGYATLSVYRAF